MPRRHWLDPLARRLLIATGQIEGPEVAAVPAGPGAAASGQGSAGAVRRKARPDAGGNALASGLSAAALTADGAAAKAMSAQGMSAEAASAMGASAAEASAAEADETVERELLALKLRHNPGLRLRTAEEVRHAAALGWSLDVNRATAADWLRLPGCRADHVDLLLRLQASGVQMSCLEDLQQLLPEARDLLRLWQPLLDFRWYGIPAPTVSPGAGVAVNRAAAAALAALPGMTPERCRRLQEERRRAPFRDLADLQERLQLPPALIEQWIGRVSFQLPPAGPVLPPAARRTPR